MPITTSCPGCKSFFRLPDELAGKQVRCQKCERMFPVPGVAPAEAAPPPPSPPPLAGQAKDEPASPPLARPVDRSEGAPPPAAQAPVQGPGPAVPGRSEVAPPPDRPPSGFWLLLTVLAFIFSVLVLTVAAWVWVGWHLTAPPGPMVVTPYRGSHSKHRFDDGHVRFDKPMDAPFDMKDGDFNKRAERPPVAPIPLAFNAVGKLERHDQLTFAGPGFDAGRFANDGPFRLYVIHLLQGKVYNFHVKTNPQRWPRLRVYDWFNQQFPLITFDGNRMVGRMMISYRPPRNGDYLLAVTSNDRVAMDFDLKIAVETRPAPERFDLKRAVPLRDSLRVEHPLDQTMFHGGPYRDYLVGFEAKKKYSLTLSAPDYRAVLRIYSRDNRLIADYRADPVNKDITAEFTPDNAGDYRLRVTSESFGLGDYSLAIK